MKRVCGTSTRIHNVFIYLSSYFAPALLLTASASNPTQHRIPGAAQRTHPAVLGHDERALAAAGDLRWLQATQRLRRYRQLDLGALQAAQLVLVVEAPDEDATAQTGRDGARRGAAQVAGLRVLAGRESVMSVRGRWREGF